MIVKKNLYQHVEEPNQSSIDVHRQNPKQNNAVQQAFGEHSFFDCVSRRGDGMPRVLGEVASSGMHMFALPSLILVG